MSKSLDLLLPIVRQKAEQFVAKCKEAGYDVQIISTLRTMQEQNDLYAIGRDAHGKVVGSVVTNARGGQSFHNWGCAFDFVPVIGGKAIWNDVALWKKLGVIGEACGLEWGGKFPNLADYGHFQFTAGYSFDDFGNGRVDHTKFQVAPTPVTTTSTNTETQTAKVEVVTETTPVAPIVSVTETKAEDRLATVEDINKALPQPSFAIKAIKWFVESSKNPNQVSMTFKGVVMAGLSKAVVVAGLLHIELPTENLTELVNVSTQFVQLGLAFVGTAFVMYGIVRKLHTQFKNK